MVSRDGPMELKTSFKIVVGILSNGLEEVFMLFTSSVKWQREMGVKESRIEWWLGTRCGVEMEGIMPALILTTLFTKNKRNLLQSLAEKTGGSGGEGQTMLFIVSKSTLGLRLLEVIRLEK